MKNHFVKINSFRYVKKELGLSESAPTNEYVVRTTVVFNLADVMSYTHPSECDSKLIALKSDVEIDAANLTAIRFKADGGTTSGWFDMQLSQFDKLFRGYLREQGIGFDDFTSKAV